jgi:hypothetical protein
VLWSRPHAIYSLVRALAHIPLCSAHRLFLTRRRGGCCCERQELVDAIVEQLPLPTGEESKLVQQYEHKLQACKEEVRLSPVMRALALPTLPTLADGRVHSSLSPS